ncbi:histidinol phosphatase [Subtercola boreus]|uniref:Histidinol phosphatase n=1 Tax=Subtercola boreus TaxID=120213 RepID=A0A3E0VW82_9MICO|nr:inositol monophosphatase family protein [Subtercola boreus]RFA13970.1 histidinol phosphatase [Subtercola boreus]
MTEPNEYGLADDLRLALDLADAADAISAERFRALDLVVEQKPDRTPVTDADRAVERAIRDGLAKERPGDAILGEEFGEDPGTGATTAPASEPGTKATADGKPAPGTGSTASGTDQARTTPHRQWIIDPIDGTANFLRGVPVWATLIALVVDGVPVLGVVSSPAFQKRWWASTGQSAWLSVQGGQPRRLAVSKVATLADASISYNSLKGWDEAGRLDALLTLSRKVWRTRAYGEMWAYMMVAEGLVDVAGEYDLQPYDVAALIPIVEEAGGRFTGLAGEDALWSGSALATNGVLHEDTLTLLAES